MTGNETDKGKAKVTPLDTAIGNKGDGRMEGQQLERLANVFEVSARRWELVVYPALFAFILLAGYGFYLIYNLTRDVGTLAHNVSQLTSSVDSMANNITNISQDMTSISFQIAEVSGEMGNISKKMDVLKPMQANMENMDHSTRFMSANMERMGYHVGALNQNIGRPMSTFNSFMPW